MQVWYFDRVRTALGREESNQGGATSTNGENTYALSDRTIVRKKTLTQRASNEGDGAKKGIALPDESLWTFSEVAIRSMLCGPDTRSTMRQDEELSMQSLSQGMRESESPGLS